MVKTVRDLPGQRAPLVNIRNRVVKAAFHDEETLALLEILAIGNQQVAQGGATPVAEVVKRLRVQLPDDCGQRG